MTPEQALRVFQDLANSFKGYSLQGAANMQRALEVITKLVEKEKSNNGGSGLAS